MVYYYVQWDGLNINVRDVYMLNYGKSVILIECLK